MLKIAIVEDETSCQEQLKGYLQQYAQEHGLDMNIVAFPDGYAIAGDYQPEWDIIFMDIRMTHMDGMEAARRIREQDNAVILIFITSMAQYAVRSYEVDAQDFILKPVSYPQLSIRLDKAVRRLRQNIQRYLLLPYEDWKEKVAVDDIWYAEVRNHSIQVVTHKRTYKLRGTLQEMEEKLAGCHFSRCNNCYLVNLRNVIEVLKDSVLVGKQELPISRSRKRQFLQELSDYLGGAC